MRKLVYRSAHGNSLPKTMDEYSCHDCSHILKLKMCFLKSIEAEKKIGIYVRGAHLSRYFSNIHINRPVLNVLINDTKII